MPKHKSNEWEFQGEVLTWINDQISRRRGLGLDKATQEPSKITPQRSDLVVWWNRAANSAFFTIELKTPEVPINDPKLLSDASEKASRWGAPCFAIWNMQMAELYKTPKSGTATPADRVHQFALNPLVGSVDDWLKPETAISLKADAVTLFETAWEKFAIKSQQTVEIEASVFVDKLGARLEQLRSYLQPALSTKAAKSGPVRRRLKEIAAEQGFAGFVENIDAAIAGQYAYRLMGQILFYFALRRKQPSLKALEVPGSAALPSALRPFWDDVRRFDYEALFKESELDALVPFPSQAAVVVRQMIEELSWYDWNKLRDDVLGSVFENLIPRSEQVLLGQFYTPAKVADLLVAFAVNAEDATVLDPGCGSGTFVMRAYDYLKEQSSQSHRQLLSRLWGFDISAFATELASINLFRQDLSAFDNFPRIISGNFFTRFVGEEIPFPPAKAGGQEKVVIEIPQFGAIVANPPYLRSQNQDDLNKEYKKTLFTSAAKSGVNAAAKTDLFAFFVYKALEFLQPGGRLGFVVSASWLTSDFGASLERVLLDRLRLIAVVSSRVESFFSQVDVNTVLIIAERRHENAPTPDEIIRFVALKKKLEDILVPKTQGYWNRVRGLADSIEMTTSAFEDDEFQLTSIPAQPERAALENSPTRPRNWSVYLRAPLSYFELFGATQ
ncbi:MAG TPA: N-6 DNA methylase [Terriglobia bacterium]|nr:N-6 DNA methylase [Terriglobia bacterium]